MAGISTQSFQREQVFERKALSADELFPLQLDMSGSIKLSEQVDKDGDRSINMKCRSKPLAGLRARQVIDTIFTCVGENERHVLNEDVAESEVDCRRRYLAHSLRNGYPSVLEIVDDESGILQYIVEVNVTFKKDTKVLTDEMSKIREFQRCIRHIGQLHVCEMIGLFADEIASDLGAMGIDKAGEDTLNLLMHKSFFVYSEYFLRVNRRFSAPSFKSLPLNYTLYLAKGDKNPQRLLICFDSNSISGNDVASVFDNIFPYKQKISELESNNYADKSHVGKGYPFAYQTMDAELRVPEYVVKCTFVYDESVRDFDYQGVEIVAGMMGEEHTYVLAHEAVLLMRQLKGSMNECRLIRDRVSQGTQRDYKISDIELTFMHDNMFGAVKWGTMAAGSNKDRNLLHAIKRACHGVLMNGYENVENKDSLDILSSYYMNVVRLRREKDMDSVAYLSDLARYDTTEDESDVELSELASTRRSDREEEISMHSITPAPDLTEAGDPENTLSSISSYNRQKKGIHRFMGVFNVFSKCYNSKVGDI